MGPEIVYKTLRRHRNLFVRTGLSLLALPFTTGCSLIDSVAEYHKASQCYEATGLYKPPSGDSWEDSIVKCIDSRYETKNGIVCPPTSARMIPLGGYDAIYPLGELVEGTCKIKTKP